MHRRYLPLEVWEWRALRAYAAPLGNEEAARLAILLEIERLAHHARLRRHSGLTPWRAGDRSPSVNIAPGEPPSAPGIEHRLYALFAE